MPRRAGRPAAERGTTLHVYAGGVAAVFADFATVIGGKLPLFIGVIIGLGFLLLMLAFRSVLVPAVAAMMNLLATGAAFGVMVAVCRSAAQPLTRDAPRSPEPRAAATWLLSADATSCG